MTSRGTAWLVFLFICITGGIRATFAANAAIDTGGAPTSKTVKLGSSGPDIMKCTLAIPIGDFTDFKWKKDTILISTIPATGKNPDPETIAAKYKVKYHDTSKYDLVFADDTTTVEHVHGGVYTCSFTPEANVGGYADVTETGTLTVVEDATSCTASSTIKVGMTKEISCTVKFNGGEPTPIITVKDSETNITGVKATNERDSTDKFTTKTISASLTPTSAGTVDYTCGIQVDEAVSKKCDIKVVVEDSTIEKVPKDTSVEVGKAGNLPCTVKSSVDYVTVIWKQTLAGGTQADICIGHKTESEYVKDSCTKADFTINDPDKHDLKIKAMKEDLVGAYECVVSDDEKYPADLMAIQAKSLKCPESEGTMTCEFEYKGKTQPTVKWYEGDTAIKDLTPTKVVGAWTKVTLVAEVKDIKKNYDCKIINGDDSEAATCRGHNTASGLSANLYQSTLLSAVVLWLWYKVL